jgi:hypothetical protein
MRIPDWVVYAVVLAVIVGTLFSSGSSESDDPFRPGSEVADARSSVPPPVRRSDRDTQVPTTEGDLQALHVLTEPGV